MLFVVLFVIFSRMLTFVVTAVISQACRHDMFSSLRYDRDWLLSVHVLSAPRITVQHRIRDLGLELFAA